MQYNLSQQKFLEDVKRIMIINPFVKLTRFYGLIYLSCSLVLEVVARFSSTISLDFRYSEVIRGTERFTNVPAWSRFSSPS